MDDEIKFLNQFAEVERHENRLPHWQQDGATYFVTLHLDDSIPKERLDQLRNEREGWRRCNPEPWSPKQEREYHERFSGQVERWLDEMHGSCVLREPAAAARVAEVLRKFDGARYRQHAWVVMPNHVHAVFSLAAGETLEGTLKPWKGVSSRRLNDHLRHTGTNWQKDYFDRMVRDTKHFWNCARYVRRNPAKARLKNGEFILHESEHVRNTLDAVQW
ncbi:MAG: transposase [Verrucomicrobia bacterium]|nr:transposase [Verrucomicrobiota bacterium]